MNKLPITALLLLIGLHGTIGFAQTSPDMESATGAAVEPALEPEADPEAEPEAEPEIEPEADKKAEDFDKRLDALLSEATAADAYGAPIHCLHRRKYRNIDIISTDLLLFSSGKNYWVNTLKRSCVGLRRNMVIHTVIKGISSLCENDMVYANSSFDLRQGLLSSGRPVVVRANCVLGEFKPIEEAYAESLKAMSRR